MKLIPLTRGLFAKVDDADYEWLMQHNWQATPGHGGSFYAAGRIKGKTVRMSRLIMSVRDSRVFVDHKDGDTLNEQRSNLRLCDRSQNGMNRKVNKNNRFGLKGVREAQKSGRYTAKILVNKKTIHLGTFPTPELAAQAYNEAAITHFGEFASLNVIPNTAA